MTTSLAAVIGFLVAVYSPIAAAASYAPTIGGYDEEIRRKIAIRLFLIVAGFVVASVWVGSSSRPDQSWDDAAID